MKEKNIRRMQLSKLTNIGINRLAETLRGSKTLHKKEIKQIEKALNVRIYLYD